MKQGNDKSSAYPHLRAAAAARSNATVERLHAGITWLEERELVVSGPSIYRVTGLAFKTIQRNPGAYNLYCAHAAYFQRAPKRKGHRRMGRRRPSEPQRDPLLNYSKASLARRLRVALADLEELHAAHAEQGRRCQEEHFEAIAFLRAELIHSSGTPTRSSSTVAGWPQLGILAPP
jgi:hypothetical protein